MKQVTIISEMFKSTFKFKGFLFLGFFLL